MCIYTYTHILIIHGFHICEFIYSPKFICNLKSILAEFSQLFVGMCRVVKGFDHPLCNTRQRASLISSFPTCYPFPFQFLLPPTFVGSYS